MQTSVRSVTVVVCALLFASPLLGSSALVKEEEADKQRVHVLRRDSSSSSSISSSSPDPSKSSAVPTSEEDLEHFGPAEKRADAAAKFLGEVRKILKENEGSLVEAVKKETARASAVKDEASADAVPDGMKAVSPALEDMTTALLKRQGFGEGRLADALKTVQVIAQDKKDAKIFQRLDAIESFFFKTLGDAGTLTNSTTAAP